MVVTLFHFYNKFFRKYIYFLKFLFISNLVEQISSKNRKYLKNGFKP